MQALLDFVNSSVYPTQGIIALYGLYCVILVLRRIQVQSFRSSAQAQAFADEARNFVAARDDEGLTNLCDSPQHFTKAVPQLILVALANSRRDFATLRRIVAERFEREVLADIEYRLSWVNTVVKTAPMLGLLGTVLGMISAFAKIAGQKSSGQDTGALANDISFALITTAVGLLIAIPLVIAMSYIHVRLGKLQDAVQQQMTEFLEDYEAARRSDRSRVA
jgi:biopolymer transport protein ExbB/TolQ